MALNDSRFVILLGVPYSIGLCSVASLSEDRIYRCRLNIVELIVGSMLLISGQVTCACQIVCNHRVASLFGARYGSFMEGLSVACYLGLGLGGGCAWRLGSLIQMLVIVALD